jgi:uncharacterized Zn finger protein
MSEPECPKCGGFGIVAKVIDWQTQAEPCTRCAEAGHVAIEDLTPRERKTWQQRERRRLKREQQEVSQ